MRTRTPSLALLLGAAALLVGCAAAGAGSGPTAVPPAPGELSALPRPLPERIVTVRGLALDDGGGEVLCPGPVMESAPPQCDGVPMVGFDWSTVPPVAVSSARWGDAVVRGTWDGATFTVTEPGPDGWAPPAIDPPVGSITDAELERMAEELQWLERPDLVGMGWSDGYLELQVAYDEGSMQAFLDEHYGPGAVVVHSSMVED